MMFVCAGMALIVSTFFFFLALDLRTRPGKSRSQIPQAYSDPNPPPPAPSELIKAHLFMRDVGYTWRGDVLMWCVYLSEDVNKPVHDDDGYIVFVPHHASLCGWLNACDALAFHHLRRDADGLIMSAQNIDPATGQPIT